MSLRVRIKPYFEAPWEGISRQVLRVELRPGPNSGFDPGYLDVISAFTHYHANGQSESVGVLDNWLECFAEAAPHQKFSKPIYQTIVVSPDLPKQPIYEVPCPPLDLLYIQPAPKVIILLLVTMNASHHSESPPGAEAPPDLVTKLAQKLFSDTLQLQGLTTAQLVAQLQSYSFQL